MEGDGAEVEDVGDEDDAVEVHAVVFLEVVAEGGGAEGAIAFGDEEFRGVPAAVAADVQGDELCEGLYILIDAPEVFVLRFADGVAEAGADWIDEDHVGLVEQGTGIVLKFIRRGRSGFGVGGEDAAGSEGSHVQPNGSGAGAAIVNEGDGPGWIFAIGAEVGSGIDEGLRLFLFVLEHYGLRDGFVGDGLAADFVRMDVGGGFYFRSRRL